MRNAKSVQEPRDAVIRNVCTKCNGTGRVKILPRWSPPIIGTKPRAAKMVQVDCIACLGTGRVYL